MKEPDFLTECITWWYNPTKNWATLDPGKREGFVKRVSIAMISEDKEEGIFTMSLLERGGPIICGESLEDVRKKFMGAFQASISISTLRGFYKKK